MSGPAFQLAGSRFATTANYGTTAYGTSHYGGSAHIAFGLPKYHMGSDDLAQSHRERVGEIVQARDGLAVSVRKFAGVGRWAVNFAIIDEANLPLLKAYFRARTFNLLPSGDSDIAIFVRWVGDEFAPRQIRRGKYALAFEIEEILQ